MFSRLWNRGAERLEVTALPARSRFGEGRSKASSPDHPFRLGRARHFINCDTVS